MRLRFKKIPWGSFVKFGFSLWLRHYKLFFFISFLIVAGLGGYEWRRSLFTYSWTPEERKIYLEATIKETIFQEDHFLSVLKKIDVLKGEHAQKISPSEELFISGKDEESSQR